MIENNQWSNTRLDVVQSTAACLKVVVCVTLGHRVRCVICWLVVLGTMRLKASSREIDDRLDGVGSGHPILMGKLRSRDRCRRCHYCNHSRFCSTDTELARDRIDQHFLSNSLVFRPDLFNCKCNFGFCQKDIDDTSLKDLIVVNRNIDSDDIVQGHRIV